MHFLITGHTGFKGAWLTLLLKQLGHEVSGLALDPEFESLFVQASLHECLTHDLRGDIRDTSTMTEALTSSHPDVVVHMAAQPLVRASYADPRLTVETNVIGTMNVLEATSRSDTVQALLIVTTDKVYRNLGQQRGYSEDDALGGDDPYSASKAMADILTQAWGTSFRLPATAILRAGNVIGGGDYSTDRLIPDLITALRSGRKAEIRYPQSVRPWQHVLDCLSGYLRVADHLLKDSHNDLEAWNVGPDEENCLSVSEVADLFEQMWGVQDSWHPSVALHPHEASLLSLNSAKLRDELCWRNVLDTESSISLTVDWYKRVARDEDPREVTSSQIQDFLLQMSWVQLPRDGSGQE